MTETIIYIALGADILIAALASVICRNRPIPTTGTVIPLHEPPIPAPKPSRIQSPFDGGGDDGGEDGDGFGAGRGGSCTGMIVPICGDSFSLLISDGFEDVVDITVGIGDGLRLNAPVATVKETVDGSLDHRNLRMKAVEFRLGLLGRDSSVVKVGIEPLKRGYVLRVEGNDLGDGRQVGFTRNNSGNATSNNRQRSRYDGGNKSHNRTERVTGDARNRRQNNDDVKTRANTAALCQE